MDNMFKDVPVSVSIIDYLGQIDNGVGLLISIVSDDVSYEVGFWFNKKGQFRLVPETKLLNKLGVIDIYKYEYLNELIYFIYSSLPDPNKIIDEFIKT